jgi:coenzyme F420-reducing hydrogenase beta subunit
VQIYTDKKDCCGCGACLNICPKHAINMQEDEYGFIYPVIEPATCINCGLCKEICAKSKHQKANKPLSVFAGISKNTDILQSASGGIFASLATSVLNDGGIVYGVSMENVNNVLTPMHIKVDNNVDLLKLLGSKYVQSFTGFCYSDVKKYLEAGKTILFSGTPCQIAGLRSYLDKDYERLFLVDIICHGVPSAKMFNDYISCLENKIKGIVKSFSFRDKRNGWGLTAKVIYNSKNGKQKTLYMSYKVSSYFYNFIKSYTYRDSCYYCQYATVDRIGDITVGDYWGIQQLHPELIKTNGGCIDEQSGCSCVLVSSPKGQLCVSEYGSGLSLHLSTVANIVKFNDQLIKPSHLSNKRKNVLKKYIEKGYREIDNEFYIANKISIAIATLKCIAPGFIKKSKLFLYKTRSFFIKI